MSFSVLFSVQRSQFDASFPFLIIISVNLKISLIACFALLHQKLRQELLSRQGSVEATRDSVSKLLQSSDASTASGLQRSLDELTQHYAAAQASQAERETELKGLLPRLESYERLGTDLQVFTQSRQKALRPVGQPDRSVDDYRQTIEVIRVVICMNGCSAV